MNASTRVYRNAYTPPIYRIAETHLTFHLDAEKTRVDSTLHFAFNDDVHQPNACDGETKPLVLHGEDLTLVSVAINEHVLQPDEYTQTDGLLTIHNPPAEGILNISVWIHPKQNTRLEGLYASQNNLLTQCEAEGFRRITFFVDRPDALSVYTVKLIAKQSEFPVLLANGNCIHAQMHADGMHETMWHDPFPKPCYLFALVAGTLVCQEETIQKENGEHALLQIWVEPGHLNKTDFALQSLKRAIFWDRKRFNLDLDLDRFMIVATHDFNMGAMENKGLNIFNAKFVLANPTVATDVDFDNIESVVGHEYFHNWTGNRITCRDWFQLSLKEGLTVFRDQEFSADVLADGLDAKQAMSARAVKRIEDVVLLKSHQFPEDAGPMAHPIRPESYQEINNFYTLTVYEKGAEVIRMLHTVLGEACFQRGMQIYIERHDGTAAMCDDFVDAMQTAFDEFYPNHKQTTDTPFLQQFRLWYSQAGTPEVIAQWHFDDTKQSFALKLNQIIPNTSAQTSQHPMHIPVRIAFIDETGQTIPNLEEVLHLRHAEQTFHFKQVPKHAVPSLLRGFSAPVRLTTQHQPHEWMHLACHDSDAFNRWDAGQRIYQAAIWSVYTNPNIGVDHSSMQAALAVFERFLNDAALSPAYKALCLQLPTEAHLLNEWSKPIHPHALHLAKHAVRCHIANQHHTTLLHVYQALFDANKPYAYNPIDAGMRSLQNTVLHMLCCAAHGLEVGLHLARTQYKNANNMTDRMAALNALTHYGPLPTVELNDFLTAFHTDPLVIDKWFAVQASIPACNVHTHVLSNVRALLHHEQFQYNNPNRARSVLSALCVQNMGAFHHPSGEGYALWTEAVITLNTINPQVAARLARAMDHWHKLVPDLKTKARMAIEQVAMQTDLSNDVQEIIHQTLAQA